MDFRNNIKTFNFQQKHLAIGFIVIVLLLILSIGTTLIYSNSANKKLYEAVTKHQFQIDLLHHVWDGIRKRQVIFREIILKSKDPFAQDELWRDADRIAAEVIRDRETLSTTQFSNNETKQFEIMSAVMREAYIKQNQTVENILHGDRIPELEILLSSLITVQDEVFIQIQNLEQLLQNNHQENLGKIDKATQEQIVLLIIVGIFVVLISISLSYAILSKQKYQDSTINKYIEDINELNRTLEKRVHERTNKLLLAKEEAERSSKAKSEFLSNMSHELRTPLNAIYGSAQILEKLTKDFNSDDKEWVSTIIASSLHLKKLVNDVLDLSKINSGKDTVSIKELLVADYLEQSLVTVSPMLQDKKISLTKSQCGELRVMADPMKFKQVLINLLSNAIKYNVLAGTIKITCEATDKNFIRIAIQDSGEGIEQEDIPRVFNMFERLGKEGTTELGSGIGLALSMKLVEMMKGDIGVQSVKGEGSTFWIDLPKA